MATKQFNRTVEAINDLLDKLDGLPTFPLVYQGEVLEYTDLPEEPVQGDCYLVSFETGTDHVSNKLYYYSGTVWKEIAVDGYTKHEIDTLLSAKQDALSSAQLAAVNSGIDSDDVEQITTNKNNILSLTPNYKGKRHTFAAADTWEEEEDLEFVLPTAKFAVIHVCFRYNNVAPRGIGITRSDMATPTMILEKRECTEDFGFFSTTCFVANTTGADMSIHFFAKAKSAGGSDVYRIYTIY